MNCSIHRKTAQRGSKNPAQGIAPMNHNILRPNGAKALSRSYAFAPAGRVFKIIFLCETVFYAVLRVLIRFATRFSMRFSYRQRLMSIIFVLHKRSLTL